MFTSPGNIAFSLGSVDVHWYGIIMSLSILIGIIVVFFISKNYFKDINSDTVCDISFLLIVFGIIFARLYYVIMDYKYFIKYPFEIPAVWNGGIAIQGAVIGGMLIGYAYARDNKLNFLRLADLFTFGLVSGQIIGRWGNFFNSEAFGLPTLLPWKLYIPFKFRPIEYRGYDFFHPAFLYESLLNIVVFCILFYILKKSGDDRKNGIIFFSYLVLYSIVRLIVETIRIDSVLNISVFHIAHIASLIFLSAGIFGLKKILNQKSS